MCWIADKMNKQISDGHVKVLKICNYYIRDRKKRVITGYFYPLFEYKLRRKYKTQLGINYLYNSVFEGFHSYSPDICHAENEVLHKVIRLKDNTIIGVYGRDSVVVDGYIPKGGIYYVNEQGEIVSDSIVLTKIQ